MSFLFGGARHQPSSAEKIAAAETEIEMVANMFNQYEISLHYGYISTRVSPLPVAELTCAQLSTKY